MPIAKPITNKPKKAKVRYQNPNILTSYLFKRNKISVNTMNITSGIHSGANIQIQGHVITLQSFKTINTIVNKPPKPIPPVAVLLFFILFLHKRDKLFNFS